MRAKKWKIVWLNLRFWKNLSDDIHRKWIFVYKQQVLLEAYKLKNFTTII